MLACLLKYDMPLEKPDDDPAATEVGKENTGPDPSIEDEGRINISVISWPRGTIKKAFIWGYPDA